MAVPDENVNPMDHFKDNFGQNFGPKRGSEVKTNSAVSFVSDMLDIKEKFDPQMFNSVAYRRTMSTLQEYNDVEKGKPRKNDVTPRFYENSGIKNIKDNELNPSFVSDCYRRNINLKFYQRYSTNNQQCLDY